MGTWAEGMDNWLLAYLMSSVLSHDSAYKKRGMPLYTQCRNLNPWRPDRPAKCYPGRTLCVGLFTPAVHSCKGHHQVQDNGRSNGLKMKRMWGVLIESQWKKSPYFNSTIYIRFFLSSWNAVSMPLENMVWNGYHKANPAFEGPTWPWLRNGSSNNPTIQTSWS